MPGSPPIKTKDPGTMPPPRTRSNSASLLEIRSASIRGIFCKVLAPGWLADR